MGLFHCSRSLETVPPSKGNDYAIHVKKGISLPSDRQGKRRTSLGVFLYKYLYEIWSPNTTS